MQFDRFLIRRYSGHPTSSYVDMFYKASHKKRDGFRKTIFTQSFAKDFGLVSSNVLVTSSNHLITKAICNKFKCKRETQWITVPKHLSEVMMIDMVVLMNTYCDLRSKKQVWDIYYSVPSATPLGTFKQILQLDDSFDDDEDISMKP